MSPLNWNPRHWPADVRWTVLVMVAVALAGGAATDVGPWYRSLVQPEWKPPDWAFGPLWTLIYCTTGWAGVRTWRRLDADRARGWFLLACGLNAMLNITWSILYFAARRPDWALAEGVALWLSAAVVALLMVRRDPWSGVLMIPHLVWVAVALMLNLATLRLNPGVVG